MQLERSLASSKSISLNLTDEDVRLIAELESFIWFLAQPGCMSTLDVLFAD